MITEKIFIGSLYLNANSLFFFKFDSISNKSPTARQYILFD